MTTTEPMTKQAATQFLGISRQVIDRLVSEGLPAELDGRGRQRFDPAAVARWLLAKAEASPVGGPGVERERERLLKAQADRAELELARARGELVEAEHVRRTWAATWVAVRDMLRNVPRTSADRLLAVAVEGRRPFATALLAEIDDALTRASTMPIDPPTDDDDAEAEDA